ncbi:PaaX family transcriptional regulator C-terminal domain-containing protein [Streptomyces sp. Z26]|uniref:PaaX family transcriptional regulator C-terminal domain-containing protein n=1 Tax=Streptomyces TaxID=1883 RepID=UPI000EF16D0A|nr:PaaX family transcriptional regulator C-terminal domain-containing protein [Streptomyces sp. Z26]RLL69579.1 PaaX domain-containing protein, C- domain protein [Streptomyces sp. Z26]
MNEYASEDAAAARGTLALRPLTARSIVLSTLLGHHPPRLPVRALVRVGELFDVAEGTVRVALSRMVAAGDLEQRDGAYGLTARLLARQTRQDDSRSPRLRGWDGRWEIALVTAERRSPAERAALRQTMTGLRLAELREGSWLRPANLERPHPPLVRAQCSLFTGTPEEDPAELVAALWDLDGWASHARALTAALDGAADLAERFTIAAAVVRHLLADPVLPERLLPPDWPGARLRDRYGAFEGELAEALRRFVAPVGGARPAGAARAPGEPYGMRGTVGRRRE